MLNNVLGANEGPDRDPRTRHLVRDPLRLAPPAAPCGWPTSGPRGRTPTGRRGAASVRFGSFVDYIPCARWRTSGATERGNADYGVVPVENSPKGGSVGQTLDLFMDRPEDLRRDPAADHAPPGGAGHPGDGAEGLLPPPGPGPVPALADDQPPRAELIESSSTRRRCAWPPSWTGWQHRLEEAAIRYGVPVLARAIQDQAHNTTRFLLVGQRIGRPSGRDKTSILFSVRDRVGALHDVLSVFARRGINLTRIGPPLPAPALGVRLLRGLHRAPWRSRRPPRGWKRCRTPAPRSRCWGPGRWSAGGRRALPGLR